MTDTRLFRIHREAIDELCGESVTVNGSLQELLERHGNALLGVTFLSSERSPAKTQSGRLDSLGLDENGCPVVVQYQRATNESVISQGLFYLDWLIHHRAEFELQVLHDLGKARADAIDWTAPRLICIAGGFTRFEEHALTQIDRNIDLVRCRRFGSELVLVELVARSAAGPQPARTGHAARA